MRTIALLVAVIGCADDPPTPDPVASEKAARSSVPVAEEQAPKPVQEAKPFPVGDYAVTIENIVLEGKRVRVEYGTNIPGTVKIMGSLNLANQKDDDVYVGTSQRATLQDGGGSVVLDTSKLPTGDYEVEAAFYPRWGLADDTAKATGLDRELVATKPLSITGSGVFAKDDIALKEGQKWVMMNIVTDTPWKPSEWKRRFGKSEPVSVEGLNPAIIKAWYFPAIDLTVFVNEPKGQVTFWRLGRASR